MDVGSLQGPPLRDSRGELPRARAPDLDAGGGRCAGSPPGQPLSGPVFRRFYRGESVGKKALTAQYVSEILKTCAARVREHSGHASWEAFGEYVKRAGTFEENPAKDVGI